MAPPSVPSRRPAWIDGLAALAVAGVAALVYRGVLAGGFLQWDDDINILNNPHVHALTWANLRWMFTDGQYMRRYLPLGWLRWAADYQLYGANPRPFHAANLCLHAADAGLLFLLIRRILSRREGLLRSAASWEVALAAIGALAWAIHPLRTEAVAWASTGQYCQAVFFLLLSALAYLRHAGAPAAPHPWRSPLLWAAVFLFLLSLLSYPVALGYLGVLIVMDIFLLRRLPADLRMADQGYYGVWREKIPFLVVTVVVLIATIGSRYTARGIWQPPPTLAEFGAGARAVQACYVWAYYVWRPFWPVHLAPVYTALVSFRPTDPIMIASVAGVLLVSGLLVWRARRWPGLLAVWLCHVVLLVPMLGLSEHPHFTNDRYCYLAAIPWSVGLAALLFPLVRNRGARIAVVLVAAGLLGWAGRASGAQVLVWRDSETLFRHVLGTLSHDPYRYDIWLRLGRVQVARGELPAAEDSFRAALALRPEDGETRAHLGLVLFAEGRTEEAQGYLGAAARTSRAEADARSALVNALLRAGWLPEAVKYGEALVRLNPRLPEAQGNLGVVLALSGRAAEGLPHLREAVRLDPRSIATRFNLALALRNLGRTDEARAEFNAVLQLDPKFAPARQALGLPAPQKP
jgi:Flp pilus assembly protein TadD